MWKNSSVTKKCSRALFLTDEETAVKTSEDFSTFSTSSAETPQVAKA